MDPLTINNPADSDSAQQDPVGAKAVVEVLYIPDSEMWTYQYLPGLENLRGPVDLLFMKVSASDAGRIYMMRTSTRKYLGQTRLAVDQFTDTAFLRGSGSLGQDYRIVYAGTPRFIGPSGFMIELQRNTQLFSYTDIAHAVNELLRSPGDLQERRRARWRRLREEVQTGVYFETLPVSLDYFFMRSASGFTYIPLNISVPGSALGQVEELALIFEMKREGKLVAQLMDTVSLAESDRQRLRFEGLDYQTRVAVRPGLHQMDLHVIDRAGNRLHRHSQTIDVPDLSAPAFNLSSLVLCKSVVDLKTARAAGLEHEREWLTYSNLNPLLVDKQLLVPAGRASFRRKDLLTVFFEVYEPALRGKSPDLEVQLRLLLNGQVIARGDSVELKQLTQDELVKVSYASRLSLASLPPGQYQVQVEIHDRIGEQRLVRQSGFTIL